MTYAGISPQNPNKYVGPYVYYPSVVLRNRPPNGADFRQPETGKYYPVASFWIVGVNPTSGTQGDLWYLSKIVANIAYWVQFNSGGGGGGLLTVTVDAITAPGVQPVGIDGASNMTIEAAAVANHSVPIETRSRALYTFKTEIQYATTAAATDGTKSGISHFSSTQFAVDATGFVTLAGGVTPTVLSIGVQSTSGGGTDPVVPNGSGIIDLEGALVAAGTIPLQSVSTAANIVQMQIQTSQAIAAADSTKVGLSNFNSSDFTVDGSGFVSLSGGNNVTPNTVINIVDDFIGSGAISTNINLTGSLTWGASQWPQRTVLEAGHPGILGNVNNGGAFSDTLFLSPQGVNPEGAILPILLGGGTIQLNWVIKTAILSTGGARYTLRVGLGDSITFTNGDQANGVYFEYSDNINGGNWVYKTAAASVRTTTNSAISVTAGWHNLGMTINAAASSVSFTVDGVSAGAAIVTNIPTANPMTIMLRLEQGGPITADSIYVDLMYFMQTLTTPR
jgi:hypothetical protein